jgi:hypothetical protein
MPFGRCGAFPLGCGLVVVLGCGLVLPLGRLRSLSLGRCGVLSSACGFGMDVASQDNGVQGQPSGVCRDPSNGGNDTLASAQHQAAVDDNPEELPVGPQGNLLNPQDQPATCSELEVVAPA